MEFMVQGVCGFHPGASLPMRQAVSAGRGTEGEGERLPERAEVVRVGPTQRLRGGLFPADRREQVNWLT
jgi:hypothetical protein